MNVIYRNQIFRLFLSIILITTASGCAKFTKQESENLAPFAQQTIDMIGSLEYGLSDDQVLYLREIHDYMNVGDPYVRYFALEGQVINMLTAVMTYSLQIVAISEQNISDNEKANELADIVVALSELVREDQVIVNENWDDETIEGITAQVRQSEDYLAALRLLLPIINEFTAHAGRVLDELRKEKQKVVLQMDEAIEKKYASAIELHDEMRTAKDDMYRTLINLSRYSVTREQVYFDKMKSYGMFTVLVATENKESLSTKELAQLHKGVTAELRIVNENYMQLQPDIKEYHKHHHELDRVAEIKDVAISEARVTFVVWSRAYQKMASGKTDPAEWFDISDSGSLLFGIAKRAAGL